MCSKTQNLLTPRLAQVCKLVFYFKMFIFSYFGRKGQKMCCRNSVAEFNIIYSEITPTGTSTYC